MKIINNLSGEPGENPMFRESRGILTTLHHEPVRGCHLKINLGAAGLVVRNGKTAIAFPLDELVKLALDNCPELVAAQPPDKS